MCGRYSLTRSLEEIAGHFQARLAGMNFGPRFNVAPTQTLPVAVAGDAGVELRGMRWGLVPAWAKEESIGNRMINARAETVAEKPSFRSSFKMKRCLVPCDGFYEWVAGENGKTPYYIHRRDNGLFAFAGLWSEWKGGESPLHTFAIITTEANDFLKPLHHRMPVILPPDFYARWLNPKTSAADLHAALKPLAGDLLEFFPVTKAVNSPKNDSPDCLVPAGEN
ncbi:MAG: SOS response-associated peptidase [Nitrospina sp.]|nr:SOS response-associated peptidase [Nitrospina sp.]